VLLERLHQEAEHDRQLAGGHRQSIHARQRTDSVSQVRLVGPAVRLAQWTVPRRLLEGQVVVLGPVGLDGAEEVPAEDLPARQGVEEIAPEPLDHLVLPWPLVALTCVPRGDVAVEENAHERHDQALKQEGRRRLEAERHAARLEVDRAQQVGEREGVDPQSRLMAPDEVPDLKQVREGPRRQRIARDDVRRRDGGKAAPGTLPDLVHDKLQIVLGRRDDPCLFLCGTAKESVSKERGSLP
jgi:hypothetical protein